MTFWSAEKLKKRLSGIVSDYDQERVGRANYTLRMGSQAYVSPQERATGPSDRDFTVLDNSKNCTIPPGQFGFLLTEETITVPHDALAFISVRATYKYKGLVNVSGFHVDPEWHGPLIFAVFNAGPSPVTVKHLEPLFHIWFADLDRSAKKAGSKEPSEPGIGSKVINGLGERLISLSGMSKRLDDLENAHEQLSSLTKVKISIWAAIAVAVLSIAANMWSRNDTAAPVTIDQRSEFSLPSENLTGQNADEPPFLPPPPAEVSASPAATPAEQR